MSGELSTLEELTLGRGATLEELVDKSAWSELSTRYYELFRVPLRVVSRDGRLLADVGTQDRLYTYLNSIRSVRRVLTEEVDRVKALDPPLEGSETLTSVTGAIYRVVPIGYDGRVLGRMIFGPVLPSSFREIPRELLLLDAELDPATVKECFPDVPRAREETLAQIGEHLRSTLDLIIFAGHKALLTSNMHMATVAENYRELQEKNTHLQEAYDRLKELDRLKSNFLATVSHELRTPLTSIIGYSEMLAEGIVGELTPEQQEFVRTIREKGEQLLELIKSLLDLSKLESGTMSLRKRDFDPGAVVRDVVLTLAPAARKKGVTLESTVDPGLPLLWADPERLRQVLVNLTENAIKFTPEGGRVGLRARSGYLTSDEDDGPALFAQTRPAVELLVSDTGIGIPEPEKRKIFDAFYQVDSSSTREIGGAGLGLSIVKRLVEGHSGAIRVEDNQPHGTVFVVAIPLRHATRT